MGATTRMRRRCWRPQSRCDLYRQQDKNSVRIEENVLSKLSNGNTPAYTVLVSMPHPNAGGEDVRLSALAWIIVQAPPATAKLTPPQSIYLKDTDGTVNIGWSVEKKNTT